MKTLHVKDRDAWRQWLSKNHGKEKSVWLIYYKKDSGKPRVPYNDAVDEAICFGWIDSTVKRIDEERFAQRFTPRRPSSQFSEMNKERARRLIKNKKMTSEGLRTLPKDLNKKEKLVLAPDVMKALKADKVAWENFQKFPDYYKRIRVAYVENQRKHGQKSFEKALNYLVKMSSKNKRYGMLR